LGLRREQLPKKKKKKNSWHDRCAVILANPNLERDGKGGKGSSWCFNSSFVVPARERSSG